MGRQHAGNQFLAVTDMVSQVLVTGSGVLGKFVIVARPSGMAGRIDLYDGLDNGGEKMGEFDMVGSAAGVDVPHSLDLDIHFAAGLFMDVIEVPTGLKFAIVYRQ